MVWFGLFYLYVMLTCETTMAFTFALPMVGIMIILKNQGLILRCGIFNVVLLIYCIIRDYGNGMNSAQDMSNFELQMGISLFCYIGYVVSIKHLNVSDNALLESIKNNLNTVVTTVDKVKSASHAVVDGVKELAKENKEGANLVADSMGDLVENNLVLSEKIDSSMEMTEDINHQVENVADLMGRIVEISEKSTQHASKSTKELKNAVESTNTMARLSTDVDSILKEFRNQFESMTCC